MSCSQENSNLFLAVKLQPDLIIREILKVASILRSKLKLKYNQISIERDSGPHKTLWRAVALTTPGLYNKSRLRFNDGFFSCSKKHLQ